MLAEIVWNKEMLAIVFVFSIPIVAIVGGIWASIEKTRANSQLKRDMIARGMSAAEIERVLSAKPSK